MNPNHDDSRVAAALREAEARFLGLPNVRSIDYGIPRVDGVLQLDQRAIRIHVHRKLEQPALEAAVQSRLTAEFPSEINGIPVDVLELKPVHTEPGVAIAERALLAVPSDRADPLEGGVGVGPLATWKGGTLGAVVVDGQSGRYMVLSNHHVLWVRTFSGTAQPVIQPSRLDGAGTRDIIGRTERHALNQSLDAAVAELSNGRGISAHQKGIGNVRGLTRPRLGMRVRKAGYSSGVTEGVITGIDAVVPVRSSGIVRRFRNVSFIEPEQLWREVSRAGDSGALWLDQTNRAMGLHFAGTDAPEKAFALDLTSVLRALNVKLLVDSRQ